MLPDGCKNLAEISLITTGLALHVPKGRIFKARHIFRKVIKY